MQRHVSKKQGVLQGKLAWVLFLALVLPILVFALRERLLFARRSKSVRQAWLLHSIGSALVAANEDTPAAVEFTSPSQFVRFCEEKVTFLSVKPGRSDATLPLDREARDLFERVVPMPLTPVTIPQGTWGINRVLAFVLNEGWGFPRAVVYIERSEAADIWEKGDALPVSDKPGSNGAGFFETADAMWQAAKAGDYERFAEARRTIRETEVYSHGLIRLSGEQLEALAGQLEKGFPNRPTPGGEELKE
jgi:hypothetical protein